MCECAYRVFVCAPVSVRVWLGVGVGVGVHVGVLYVRRM